MTTHPENVRAVTGALQRIYGVLDAQFNEEQITLVVAAEPSFNARLDLQRGVFWLLGVTSIPIVVEVAPPASTEQRMQPCAPPPGPAATEQPATEQPANGQAQDACAPLAEPSWIICTDGWDGLPKTLRLLLGAARYDADKNLLVVQTSFHARKINEQRPAWEGLCRSELRVVSAEEAAKEVSQTVSKPEYDSAEGTFSAQNGSFSATAASEIPVKRDQSSPNNVLTAQSATDALEKLIMYNEQLSQLTGKVRVSEWEPTQGVVTVQVDGLEALFRVQQERSWFCRMLATLAGACQPSIPVTFENVEH